MSDAVKPATYAAHKEAPSSAGVDRVTMKEICGGGGDRLVLWDVTHVRLAADWTTPPATPPPSPNPNARAAHDDDADFFATGEPCHLVSSIGTALPRPRKKLS